MDPLCRRGSLARLLPILALLCMSVTSCSAFQSSLELWHGPGARSSYPQNCDQAGSRDHACHHRVEANQSLSCETDLGGFGSLDKLCTVNKSVEFDADVLLSGAGSLSIENNASLGCYIAGCEISIILQGNFILDGSITGGTLVVYALNITVSENSVLSTRALGGAPPSQTSGVPQNDAGAGGGHGGRGAMCVSNDDETDQGDVWGGDDYAWSTLENPWSYGSKGGSTSKTENHGGGGGGRVNLTSLDILHFDGHVDVGGGSGGEKGGGGSGGSAAIYAHTIEGVGSVTASGGSGRAGGGGGRIALRAWRSTGITIRASGGHSFACPNNTGGAGTAFDGSRLILNVHNNGEATQTETLLLDFPHFPLWDGLRISGGAKVVMPLLWSRVQVRGEVKVTSGSTLAFGLVHFQSSEFDVVCEQFDLVNSSILVFGALKLQTKLFFMERSNLHIEGGFDTFTSTSDLDASSIFSLKEGSVVMSNSNLGLHGQGLMKLSGSGDIVKAERLFISLFFTLNVGPGAILQAPLFYDSPLSSDEASKRGCTRSTCPDEVLNPSEDCTLNVSSPFTLQFCRVEELVVTGTVEGSMIHAQRIRTITIPSEGLLTASGWGCRDGLGKGKSSDTFASGGGGHGGMGGQGYFDGSWAQGGNAYGNPDLPCELGSGSGNSSTGAVSAGGGIIVLGSGDHPVFSVDISGSMTANGASAIAPTTDGESGSGGGSGGTLLIFLEFLALRNGSVLSTGGGHGGSIGGGGGSGGRVHFHWSNIATGEDYLTIANVKGSLHARGGSGSDMALTGGNGSISGRDCPEGLFGIFCEECPIGTYKNVTGSGPTLCQRCSPTTMPRRASYVYVRGGAINADCPFVCNSEKYRMPHCYTPVEELIYTLGGPWWFTIFLSSSLVLLALVLSVARLKLIGSDDFSGPTPHNDSHIDHTFPFLESLNEVLETTRVDESQTHIHRMFFMGCNCFGEPWHLPHTPPEQIIELVYEDAYNRFVDEINTLAAYQWWEGSVHSILSVAAFPLAWHWMQWRQKNKVQHLREYVRSEYDHACLRSCRSRALYEGLKVGATPDLMLAYIDVFLGGDEKRPDLPPRFLDRLPMSIMFGGDGTYMAPYFLHSDNLLTSLVCQCKMPATVWYRFVGGLNAHLRTVRRGSLRDTLLSVINWINSHVNPKFLSSGIRVDLAWFHATASGYYQLGIVLDRAGITDSDITTLQRSDSEDSTLSDFAPVDHVGDFPPAEWQLGQSFSQLNASRRRIGGAILDAVTLRSLEDSRDLLAPFSILRNVQPIGHQAAVGLIISLLLLADLSFTFLTLLQFFSISLRAFLLVLFVLPLASVLASAAGLNALFSHGPRRAAGLARVYALWNITSFSNVFVALIYGSLYYIVPHFISESGVHAMHFNLEDDSWWLFPILLIFIKCIQAWMVNLQIANLEIQDRTVYSDDPTRFWHSS